MRAVAAAAGEEGDRRFEIVDIVSVCKTSYDSFDFIAGNRLFRYTMEVTEPHYTRGEITVCVYGRVYVRESVSRGVCMHVSASVCVCGHIYI